MKEEPVDILDEQGNKTGQTMLKTEAHKQGLWHGAVHIWIYNSKGEVLLQLRSPQKVIQPNIWDVSVGGHIGAGKSLLGAAVEEAEEELGLRVDAKDLQPIGETQRDDLMPGDWHHRVHIWIYALRMDDLKLDDLILEKAEVSAARWTSIEDLRGHLDDPKEAKQYSPNPISIHVAIEQIPKLLERR